VDVVLPGSVGFSLDSARTVRAETRIPDTRVFPSSVVAIEGRGVVVAARMAERPVHPRTPGGAARRGPRLLDGCIGLERWTAGDMHSLGESGSG
jgi:hypothetical protein